jgi:hypothetical protein
MLWVDSEDVADEGLATPPHTEISIDTRIADALETLHAAVTWDERTLSWVVFYVGPDGYPVYEYGHENEPRRAVLTRWLLNEKGAK